jgi:uncharacterized delta-60 repeat protein
LQNQKKIYINLENGKLKYSFKKGGFMSKVFLSLFLILFFTLPLFAQSVDTAWVKRYNGPENSVDHSSAMAVDGSGNIYVTGYSYGIGTDLDYAAIKYNSNGDTVWVRRYNGPGNDWDYTSAIDVDGFGNVYVTGESYNSGTYNDYATIKYNSNGDTTWVRRYDGPASYYDYASAIAVDSSGSIYVTGRSPGSMTYFDYATIKYNSNGDTVWVRRYNGPGNSNDFAYALAVDDSSNVYVTGNDYSIETEGDYATIKYNSNGDTVWVRRYNGPGDGYDYSYAIAVDGFGNVYVTGSSSGSGTYQDYATIKYYPNGDTAWVRRYNGPGNSTDWASGIAVDNFGNVYVTGNSKGSGTNADYATLKYDSNGDTVWVRRYNGPGNGLDNPSAITLDGSGNVYVTGESPGSGTLRDYATIKYDPAGNQLWEKRYNGPGNDDDEANAIAVDGSGNVYVTGGSEGSGGYSDFCTIKYVQFLRGDANKDGNISLSDVVCLINYLFKFGPTPEPIQSGDANCDGKVSLSDIVYLINYLFKFGPAPCI